MVFSIKKELLATFYNRIARIISLLPGGPVRDSTFIPKDFKIRLTSPLAQYVTKIPPLFKNLTILSKISFCHNSD